MKRFPSFFIATHCEQSAFGGEQWTLIAFLRRNGISFPCFAGVIYHCAHKRRAFTISTVKLSGILLSLQRFKLLYTRADEFSTNFCLSLRRG